MDQKEFLSQAFNLDRKIYLMQLEAEEYRRLSRSIPGGDYSQPKVDKSPTSSEAPFVQWIYKALDKEKEIEELTKNVVTIKNDIMNSIGKLDNDDQKLILTMRYINSSSFPSIANKLYVSLTTLKRWHKEAVEKIVVPDKYKSL